MAKTQNVPLKTDTKLYARTKKIVLRNHLSVFYKGIDYLTVRISNRTRIAIKLYGLVGNSNTHILDH